MLIVRLITVVSLVALAAAPERHAPAPGQIRGRINISGATGLRDRPSVADLAGHRRDPVDRRRAVVYLETAPSKAFEEVRVGRYRMDQRGEQFVPRVLAITVGSSVEFPNSDTTFHNVFSLAPGNAFDLGRYRPGRTGSVRFERAGIVPVSCDIHAHMGAYILVFSHPFYAVTDEDDRYVIANVPVGTYSLAVWSEVGRPQPRRVTVGDGETVEADFRVGPEQP